MGSMIAEMDARMAAGEDFDLGANANPHPKQSAAWRLYEDEFQALTQEALDGRSHG